MERKLQSCALGQTVAGLKLQRPRFNPTSGHVGFVMDTMALRHNFFQMLQFSSVIIIHSVLHIHLLICHQCNLSN